MGFSDQEEITCLNTDSNEQKYVKGSSSGQYSEGNTSYVTLHKQVFQNVKSQT